MAKARVTSPEAARGFTLIELMITVAIVGILAALAYPSFVDVMRKGRRADAVAALTRVQHAQERFRANRATYSGALDATGADPDALPLADTSPDGHYTIALLNAGPRTYTATATAAASSPQAGDSKCRVLRIALGSNVNDHSGLVQFSSTNSANVTDSSANNPCWVK